MTEKEFQKDVIDLARQLGWEVYHCYNSRLVTSKGFPDLVLAHPIGRVVFAELKTAKGRVSREQKRWIWMLKKAGLDARVWRPSH